jgi:nucleoside-diphosphate-sugar epimerase
MIIGSGLLAHSFKKLFYTNSDICIYAAGVSNSNCASANEFERERNRLSDTLQRQTHIDAFVYFGTCSVGDADVLNTPYVRHKLLMEKIVSTHPRHLILRLPQVAGETPNPHTLLNFLYARIARSESFNLWRLAKRNIIDVSDVAAITKQIIANNSLRSLTFNIANAVNYSLIDIVHNMEYVVGKRAVYELLERGSEYKIDTKAISPFLEKAGVDFDDNYLEKVIIKYYKK